MVDACVHTDAYKRTEKDFDYKLYIMELAMEWVEEKCQIELSRSKLSFFFLFNSDEWIIALVTDFTSVATKLDFQLPGIKSKDELKKRSVILPKPPAIQEVDDNNNNNSVKRETPEKVIITPVSSKPAATSTKPEQDKDARIKVPAAGKEDIALMSRLLPCPKGTLGIIVEVDLPNHVSDFNKVFLFFLRNKLFGCLISKLCAFFP